MFTFILVVIVLVLGYVYFTTSNIHEFAQKSRRVGLGTVVGTKEVIKTTRKGTAAIRDEYDKELTKEELKWAKAGSSYQEHKREQDLIMVRAIKNVFEPTNKFFDEVSVKAQAEKEVYEAELARFHAKQQATKNII